MTWPFTTLRILHPILSLSSLITISLLSAWVSSTSSFFTSFDSYYTKITDKELNSSIKFPTEIYFGFVFSMISFSLSAVLCFPTVSRRFGYTIVVYLADVFLSIFWFLLSIVIVARVNGGSVIDSKGISDQLSQEIIDLQTNYTSEETIPDDDKSLSLGKAITALSWIQFITWTFTTIILAHIRSRKWSKKDQNKRITILSNSYDKDAKMLNTPVIMKEIDELVRNPQTAQPTKETSSKSPVLELDFQLSKNTTTTYSLDPASFTSNKQQGPEDDFYSAALYDYK